ncbi:MAG: ABC transporter permease subunit [Firmicutes bacterium]|nr:ABC transporter permease subunit [Bacillota bacterium]
MILFEEYKKVKRLGFFPALFTGSLLTAAIPIINMAFRGQLYLDQQASPIQILLAANWQMMAMLNLLLTLSGSCILYHAEYADNAMEKLKTLPLRESSVFLGKAVLMVCSMTAVFAVEAAAIAFCSCFWFEAGDGFAKELCESFGYSLFLTLPCMVLSLLISQACRNMWVSLGIGVICVFTATLLPANSFVLSLFPFAIPFQILPAAGASGAVRYLCAAAAGFAIFILAEPVLRNIRRSFE